MNDQRIQFRKQLRKICRKMSYGQFLLTTQNMPTSQKTTSLGLLFCIVCDGLVHSHAIFLLI